MTRCENAFLQTAANADNAGFSRAMYTVTRKFDKKSGTIHALVNEASEAFSNKSCIFSAIYATGRGGRVTGERDLS